MAAAVPELFCCTNSLSAKPAMEALKSPFLQNNPLSPSPHWNSPSNLTPKPISITCSVTPDPWTLSDGNRSKLNRPKPRSKNPKNPLSDDNARRIIKAKARYQSALRRNQGSAAQTPRWVRRTPEQMVQYLQDDRHGHLYGKHVVAAIRAVRSLAQRAEGSYDMREVMGSFVAKLTFREMCIVLKEQKGWRQARDFFAWMKLQLCYHPSVIVYTILLRTYGQIGRIKLSEQTFLEMLEAGCEPDEVACGTMLCTYARWGRHKAMLSFYSAVQERGIILSVAVFNFMISCLHKKSLYKNGIEMWRQMVEKGVVPNPFTYTIVISSLVKEGLDEEAFRTFDEMRVLGFVPEEVTYGLLLNVCSKNNYQVRATTLYDDMRSQGLTPSNFTCASLITLHYKNRDYSKAVSLFTEMEKYSVAADEVIYGLLIRIYGKLGLPEEAEKTFEEIEKLGLLSDEKTYVTMALVHLNSGNAEKALDIMNLMRSRNLWFSRFAYIVLLRCYAMKGDLKSAEVTFQVLTKTGVPDAASCNDMLNLYVGLGLTEKANKFIVQLRKYKTVFDEDLYKTALKLYCREDMLSDAEQLIEEMATNQLCLNSKFTQTILTALSGESWENKSISLEAVDQPDTIALELMVSLHLSKGLEEKAEDMLKALLQARNGSSVGNQLINKFIREGSISKAENLYRLLIKLGCRMEDATSASMISFYGKRQMLKQAEEVFSGAIDSSNDGKVLYAAVFDAYAICGKADEACFLYKKVIEGGCDVGAVATSILVNTLTNYGKHQDAIGIIEFCLRGGLELDTVAYNTFIKAMLRAGKLHFAATIFEHMVSSEVAPSIQTYNTMISVYGRGKNLEKAVQMFNKARDSGVSLDEKAYTNMIHYYGKAGKNHEASLLFEKMRDEGINPGKVSCHIMLNVYASSGLYQEAEELMQVMQSDGCSPDSISYLALVQAYTRSMKYANAEETLDSMQKEGIPPSCAHFNQLLSAFMKCGLITEAERVYSKILEAGLTPDLACIHSMIRGYLDYGHTTEGISFFETISKAVKPDRFTLSAAVHFYESAGMDLKAQGLLTSMRSLGISFIENLEVGSRLRTS